MDSGGGAHEGKINHQEQSDRKVHREPTAISFFLRRSSERRGETKHRPECWENEGKSVKIINPVNKLGV